MLIVPLLLTACPSGANRTKNGPDLRNLPREIRSGEQGPFHVQGIAVDLERGYIYFSFTTKLLKMDFLLASDRQRGLDGPSGLPDDESSRRPRLRLAGIQGRCDRQGHPPDARRRAVPRKTRKDRTGFYVAIFDVDRITRPDMDAEKDRVMTTVYIKEAVDDYFATAENGGRTVEHRFGCSGIDGVTFAPRFGAKEGGDYLYAHFMALTATPARLTITRCRSPTTRRTGSVSSSRSRREVCMLLPAVRDHKHFVRTGTPGEFRTH